MEAYNVYSHSPALSALALPQRRVPAPITPVHSPQHSIHSSTSLRTPFHTLSIHEYRKQQSTPLEPTARTSGKTLRRKASACALNGIDRDLSTKPALSRDSYTATQSLHSSYSAHQLISRSSSLRAESESDQLFRSRSAEPCASGGGISSVATVELQGKTRFWGTRKRLPRPFAATASESRPLAYKSVRTTRQFRATSPAPLSLLTKESDSSDTISSQTPSLSRFPQPPQFETLREAEREKAISLGTIAPATPPATPATIHYRGASFDLINPHASLPYHDIVTPSRDFDSNDRLPFRASHESQSSLSEMVPKRPLYGDLNAAHAGIVRRTEETYLSSMLDLPLPPTPTAVTPGSSTYASPVYSPDSHFAPSPLAFRKTPDESRFSVKQLARTLTRRLTKPIEYGEEEELQQFRESEGILSNGTDVESLRSFEQTYIPTTWVSHYPVSPVSPSSSTSRTPPQELPWASGGEKHSIEFVRRDPGRFCDSKGLMSMVPNNESAHVERADDPNELISATESGGRPYYDDLASIYASSSIYTGDDYQQPAYQRGLGENRQSDTLLRYSSMSAVGMGDEHSCNDLEKLSRPISRTNTQGLYPLSIAPGDGKTDTISKLIDQYNDEDRTESFVLHPVEEMNSTGAMGSYTGDEKHRFVPAAPQGAMPVAGSSPFRFDLERTNRCEDAANLSDHLQLANVTKRTTKSQPRLPPSTLAPLAPAFQYGRPAPPLSRPEFSDMFSIGSQISYGDTRNLLQLSQSEIERSEHRPQASSSYSQYGSKVIGTTSSYSQPESLASLQTPQEALDQAELIFDKAAIEFQPSQEGIPAMWGRQSPVNMPRHKRHTDEILRVTDHEKADWETIAGDSQHGRMSLDSVADYSSSEGSRNSLSFSAAASRSPCIKHDYNIGPSVCSHSSPMNVYDRSLDFPLPHLTAHTGPQTTSNISPFGVASNSPVTTNMPVSRFPNERRHAVDEPYAFAPWADPYALSDKETQELLASGPNDDIMVGNDVEHPSRHPCNKFKDHEKLLDSSSPHSVATKVGLGRKSAFGKFTNVGLGHDLTGTPQSTELHDARSSLADASSSGAVMRSNFGPNDTFSKYDGFYASPDTATGSATWIRCTSSTASQYHERTPSQITLFPSSYTSEPMQGSSPLVASEGQGGLRLSSTSFKPARRTSRAAVRGQTKLRQMVLAPDVRSTMSSKDPRFSRFVSAAGSGRPSTSDTVTPLHPTHLSLDSLPTTGSANTNLVHQHSPHLLCPERKSNEGDETRRRKLSWLIFACFCILPPCMFLYRTWGDSIIVSITKGDLGHCTVKSKRAALIAGAVVNVGLITAILVPILVAQALKAI